MESLTGAFLRLFPLPPGINLTPADRLPPPRVSMNESTADALQKCVDPLEHDRTFRVATVKSNKRITANDWYQDVRHFEFQFGDHIQYADPLQFFIIYLRDSSYAPGDVAVIHPIASPSEVETFLNMMSWGNIADSPFEIDHTMQGSSFIPIVFQTPYSYSEPDQSLPDHLPRISTLRTLLRRYVDINAVPRRSFFQYLRYFTSDELEQEKLDEFLSTEGAVSFSHFRIMPIR